MLRLRPRFQPFDEGLIGEEKRAFFFDLEDFAAGFLSELGDADEAAPH